MGKMPIPPTFYSFTLLLLSVAVGEWCRAGALLEEVGHGALVAQIIYFHRICLLLIYVVQNYKKNL